MSTRIPPSLKWLIDKRARLEGEILKTKKSLNQAHKLIDELNNLNETLAAIDKTLELHEIKINVHYIQPIKSKYVRLKLPYGALTKGILICLRLYTTDGNPINKSEIIEFIIARYTEFDEPEINRGQIAISIKKTLQRLLKSGVVKRYHELDGSCDGRWSIQD